MYKGLLEEKNMFINKKVKTKEAFKKIISQIKNQTKPSQKM